MTRQEQTRKDNRTKYHRLRARGLCTQGCGRKTEHFSRCIVCRLLRQARGHHA